MNRIPYSTDLTDAQWARIAPLIPPAKPGGRRRTVNVREIVNAILYFARTGCQWRNIPHDFPPWGTVSTITIAVGASTEAGRKSTTLCASRSAPKKRAVRLLRVQPSSIPKASKPPKKGASRLRRGQAANGAQAPHRGGHLGVDPDGSGSRGEHPGS